jgi:multidrug resistance efflux pump
MRITIRKSIIIAITMLILLAAAVTILTFMKIDRKVIVPGSFNYRRISPVVSEESGFVSRVFKDENSLLAVNDTILALRNDDLAMEMINSESKIMIFKFGLEEILQLKELDVSLSSYDISKLKEELKVKKEESEYYKSVLTDKSDLYEKKIVSKDEYEAANIALKQKELEIKSIEIQISELNKRLQKLDTSTYLSYKLKQKELEIEQEKLTYLKKRNELLSVTARMNGKLVSEKTANFLNSYLPKGTKIGDIVSENEIDFTGYASGSDIIRVKEGQKVFFNVDTFRGKDFISGIVRKIGLKPETFNGTITFPVEIEVTDNEFFDSGRKRFIHAGVVGEAIIITEEDLPILKLLWEQIVKYADIN